MKKTIFVIVLIFVTIIICIYMNYRELQGSQREAQKFNANFEFYNKPAILGTNITTIINKAIDNNETYNIPKDEKGLYLPDEKNSIKIYVHMLINGRTYPMEQLKSTGLDEFTRYFGEVEFKCANVKYHKSTGKIAEMTFEATQM